MPMRRLQHSGVGLRHAHHAQALAPSGPQPGPAFVEVHSENFFGDGGAALQQLEAARAVWPVSGKFVTGAMPTVPRRSCSKVAATPRPSDVTAPTPVMTTRSDFFGRGGMAASHLQTTAAALLPPKA